MSLSLLDWARELEAELGRPIWVYDCGPMRGYPYSNFPAFIDSTLDLRENFGLSVVSPAEHDIELGYDPFEMDEIPDWFDVNEVLKWDLEQILHMDAIVVLPGWEDSVGANLEIDTARRVGIPIFSYETGELLHKPQVIIGFAGYAQAGKDTAAAYLVEHGFTRGAFADALKSVLYKTNPINSAQDKNNPVQLRVKDIVDAFGWEEAKKMGDIRELLQRLGMAAREEIKSSVWVDAVFEQKKDAASLVISDVRFPNEVEAIRNRGGRVIRIERASVTPINEHISENALDGYEYDAYIYNNFSIEDLHQQIQKTLYGWGIEL